MAKTTITSKKVTFRTEALKRAAAQSGEVRKQLADQHRKVHGKKMQKIVEEHYQEVFDQAARITREGLPGGWSGAGVLIGSRFPDSAVSASWPRFAMDYAIRKLRERPGTEDLYWRFTGSLGRYLTALASMKRKISLTEVKAEPAANGRSAKSIRVSSTLTVPSTGDPVMDGLVRNSFVQGNATYPLKGALLAGVEGTQEASPQGVLAMNDFRRPFISRLAAALGARAQRELGKISQ